MRLTLLPLVAFTSMLAAQDDEIIFSQQIRPILADTCFKCHGPDEKKRKAKLRFDIRDGGIFKMRKGHQPVVAGSPDKSELYERLTSSDEDKRMPPPESGRSLTKAQVELIRKWIEQGARWQEHWSFERPKKTPLPKVKDQNWAKSPIDRFILSRLEKEGLTPSPEAGRRALVRRVTFDIIGLPPTPEEVQTFLKDTSDNAFEKVVDRLLESKHYGEHRARFWLDAVRYGDTHGLHLDNYREMWAYRDWVIKAFNDNLPFDQATIKQIAGDLLDGSTDEDRVASGYNRCHVTTSEGGSISEEVYVRNVVDRVSTTGTVFMGMTLGCAVCHEHKFDPISQQEFYQLFAFFNNLEANPLDGNKKDHAPVIRVMNPEATARMASIEEQTGALEARINKPLPDLDAKELKWAREQSKELREQWEMLTPVAMKSTGGATLKNEGSIIQVGGENPDRDVYEIVVSATRKPIHAIRLQTFVQPDLPHKSTGRASNGNFVMTEFEVEAAQTGTPDKKRVVKLAAAQADYSQQDFDVSLAIDGNPGTGWASEGHVRKETCTAWFFPAKPIAFEGGAELVIRMKHDSKFAQHSVGRFQISVSDDAERLKKSLPPTFGPWSMIGPFTAASFDEAHDKKFGPEKKLDLSATYKDGKLKWVKKKNLADGKVQNLQGANAATYLYRTIQSSSVRAMHLSLGSDDSIKVWLNGEEVLNKKVARAVKPDQEKISVELRPGKNELLMKIVNGGGGYGYYFSAKTGLSGMPAQVVDALTTLAARRNENQKTAIRSYYRKHHWPEWKTHDTELKKLQTELKELEKRSATTLVMKERAQPRQAYMLNRGQYDQRREKVGRRVPKVFPPLPKGAPRNRLGFARWLVSPDHPLTSRVIINQVWQQFFGAGIVRTTEDFGAQGEPPSHPELLDWLAVQFVEDGWDIKKSVKRIVMSAAYQQSSKASLGHRAKDPTNRLYSRGPRHRLDAEMLRDQALAVSGLLNRTVGGPSVKPPQPGGLWFAVGYTRSNTARFAADTGDKIYRRSVYTFWKRTSPPPQFSLLDAPSREQCSVRRERTNTPLQALLIMNERQYVECARHLAQRMMKQSKTPEERFTFAFEACTSRLPRKSELAEINNAYEDYLKAFKADEAAASQLAFAGDTPPDSTLDPIELAANTMVANLILNLDEVLNKP